MSLTTHPWSPRSLACACTLLLPLACVGRDPGMSGSGTGDASTTTADPPSPTTSTASTTTAADDTTSTGSEPTGSSFNPEPDGGGTDFECDIFEQDCPRGYKCTEWANDGGSTWNAAKCVPVVADPAGTGEPCHVEGWPLSGLDDCDYGAICLYVDPRTLEGTCTPFCVGSPENPYCVDEDRFCPIYSNGAIVFCVLKCNPVLDSCDAGQVCVPTNEQWMCAQDASGDMGAYGDPCESINVCDPGLLCLGTAAVPPGEACEGAAGCCTEVCDITDPAGDAQCTGAAGGQTCQAWYAMGKAPAGYENVGVCALP